MAVNLPNSPSDGQTTTAGGQTLVWDATAGVWNIQAGSGSSGASLELSDSAPSSPAAGDMWFDTTDFKLYAYYTCLLYTSPSPRDATLSRMPSSA